MKFPLLITFLVLSFLDLVLLSVEVTFEAIFEASLSSVDFKCNLNKSIITAASLLSVSSLNGENYVLLHYGMHYIS